MSRTCPVQGCYVTLADDEEICRGSARRLRTQLQAIPDLLDELDTALARIGSSEPGEIRGSASGGCKPGCDHLPDNPSCVAGVVLDVNLAASEATAQLRSVLHGWARVWDEETPITIPDSAVDVPAARRIAARMRAHALGTASRQALLLATQPLGARPWAPDIANEIAAAVRKAERAIDIAPDVTLAGTCSCGMAVYATAGEARARCRWCGLSHDPDELYDAMIAARGHLHTAPAAVIARMLVDPRTGKPLVTAAQIRGWKHRDALEVDHVNAAGQPEYRIDDVVRLARDGAPSTEQDVSA